MSRAQKNPTYNSQEEIKTGIDEGLKIPGSSLDGDISFEINFEVERLQ